MGSDIGDERKPEENLRLRGEQALQSGANDVEVAVCWRADMPWEACRAVRITSLELDDGSPNDAHTSAMQYLVRSNCPSLLGKYVVVFVTDVSYSVRAYDEELSDVELHRLEAQYGAICEDRGWHVPGVE